MSIKTWKEEFYLVDARDVPKEEALAHSIKKWRGLTPENLAKHDLRRLGSYLHDDYGACAYFGIDTSSCALCTHYYSPGECYGCPLYQHLGARCDNDLDSPYGIFVGDGDPKPMIVALKGSIR